MFTKTFERVQKLDKSGKSSKDLTKLYETPKTNINQSSAIPLQLENEKNNHWCKIMNKDKSYCFQVPKKRLCIKGKLVKNRNDCDFY